MNYFTEMAEMRRMEIVADMLYKEKLIRGFCHLYDGQEAVAIGMKHSLNYEDAIIGAYRIHGIALSRGDTSYKILAEMM